MTALKRAAQRSLSDHCPWTGAQSSVLLRRNSLKTGCRSLALSRRIDRLQAACQPPAIVLLEQCGPRLRHHLGPHLRVREQADRRLEPFQAHSTVLNTRQLFLEERLMPTATSPSATKIMDPGLGTLEKRRSMARSDITK
jgi:hypothetical protein